MSGPQRHRRPLTAKADVATVCWWECSIAPGHSSGGGSRWAVYWTQSWAERAAQRAAVPGDRPRTSARTAEGLAAASWNIAALPAAQGWMPCWTSCPRMFPVTRCLPGRWRRDLVQLHSAETGKDPVDFPTSTGSLPVSAE
ncbi:MAG TPA: hypothetical protein VFE45_16155, partial [Coriobacteriia bacterium]|nr:hypothetical protein [Coriobacteriia bacterium]